MFIVLSFLLLVRVIVLLNTCSLMLSCSVFSPVCLCVLLLCVRGRPPLWRGTVTQTNRGHSQTISRASPQLH